MFPEYFLANKIFIEEKKFVDSLINEMLEARMQTQTQI
jgi:hypothetical protein